jgi:hypothetical protein
MDAKPVIRITVDGQPALTIDLAAEAQGLGHHAMRHALDRAGAEPIKDRAGNPVTIGRQPLYAQAVVDEVLANRKGRGAPGVPRPHRSPAERAAKTARTDMGARLRAKAQP